MVKIVAFCIETPHILNILDQTENLTPETFASFPSKMLFSWFDSLAWKGWRSNLVMAELWNLPSVLRCRGVIPIWDKHWDSAKKGAKKGAKKEVSILSTLVYSFGVEFGMSAVLTLIYTILQFASPQLVNFLIG